MTTANTSPLSQLKPLQGRKKLFCFILLAGLFVSQRALADGFFSNLFSPLIGQFLSILLIAAATALASALTAAGVALAKRIGLEVTAKEQQNMEDELLTVLKFGISKTLPLIEAQGWNTASVKSAILGAAQDFLRERFPDRAAKIIASASGSLKSPSEAINDSLTARLPQAMAMAARHVQTITQAEKPPAS